MAVSWPTRIETERLVLRPLAEADLPTLVREIGRWEVARWLILVPHPYTEADGRSWLGICQMRDAERSMLHFAAAPKHPGADPILGAVSLILDRSGAGAAELGYWIAPHAWRQGFGTEMARAMLEAGFRDLRLDRIVAFADPGNGGSNGVLRRIGMTLEAVEPEHERGLRGPPGPINRWAIARKEWEAVHGARG